MSNKVYQILTDSIVAMIDAGTAPWLKPWKGSDAPRNINGRPYRGINAIMLPFIAATRGYTSPVWLTYNMIKERNGTIKEGQEKAHTPVYLWNWVKRKDATTGEETTFPIFKFFLVWNLQQVDGIELPATEAREPVPVLDACEAIVAGMPNRPEITHGGNKACYWPALDKVSMPMRDDFVDAEKYYSTLFHELAHSTGHRSRLNRKEVDSPTYFGSHDYSREELVAELTACFLSAEAGIEGRTIENSAAYLAGWSKALRSDPTLFATAASRAQKAADYILNRKDDKAEAGG
jgi:antirestriction protein ArdC